MKLYRDANHPEYVAEVIVPALAHANLPAELAPHVAALVNAGCSVTGAIDALQNALA